MRNISYGELVNCEDYAQKVVDCYKMWNHGKVPLNRGEAELAVREYNNEIRSFKAMYGYSIRGYVNTIVDCIGLIVER